MTNPIESMTSQLATIGDPEMTDKQMVARSLEQMREAIKEGQEHDNHAFKCALAVGYHADIAKGAMPKDQFAPWLEKNFGEASKTPLSVPWLYKCINASRAFNLLPKGVKKQQAILTKFGTVKKLAGILATLENGDDPLALEEAQKPAPKRGAPTKAQRAAKQAKDAEPADNGEGANDLALESKRLARLDKALAIRAKQLDERETALDERERLLEMREAALGKPGTVSDVAEKLANAGEEALEKARVAIRKSKGSKSAIPSPTSDATSAAKPKAKGSKAKTPKTAPVQPEGASAAAPEPVRIDTKGGESPELAAARAPEGDAAQAGEAF